MSNIHIKIMSDKALTHLSKNIKHIVKKIQDNETNEWINSEFPQPMFIEKKYEISDFELENNPESENKEIDFNNSIKLYESLNSLPRYILTSEAFWLWLHFEKFYPVVRKMMTINGESTITDHWMHKQGTRRGLMFGVLSRCYFRVALTVDESKEDKYELTKWIIENPLRYRELTWRSYSSEEHLVRGILKGEKKAVDENPGKEKNKFYPILAKAVSEEGSIKLLDAVSEEDIESFAYGKMKQFFDEDKEQKSDDK